MAQSLKKWTSIPNTKNSFIQSQTEKQANKENNLINLTLKNSV